MTSATLSVQQRYSVAARTTEQALCCPVTYPKELLAAIPAEVLERDYGCGDPSRWVRPGDTVLDLGSGGGKICFIASQIVGPEGRVIGVDRNREMLDLARRAAPQVAAALGYTNVEFRCGSIQDLALDLEAVDDFLRMNPARSREDLWALHGEEQRLRREEPLIADESVDVVVSNCVLNLVDEGDRAALFRELFRVVKVGGRVAISDIVCDETVPEHLRGDASLWSGCISGAYREDQFLQAFADAGFYGVELAKRDEQPWQVVDDIEFRSVTVVAYKGKQGPCLEGNEAVIYRGPWSEVRDDDGHVFVRGEPTAVCAKTYRLMTSEPYARHMIGVPPRSAIAGDAQQPFACVDMRRREARETKNGPTPVANTGCNPASGCC